MQIIYAGCQASPAFCSLISDSEHLDALLDILLGKVRYSTGVVILVFSHIWGLLYEHMLERSCPLNES